MHLHLFLFACLYTLKTRSSRQYLKSLSTTRLIPESLLSIFVLPYILEHHLKQNGRYQITPRGI